MSVLALERGMLVGWLDDWLVGWQAGWQVDCMVSCLVGQLFGNDSLVDESMTIPCAIACIHFSTAKKL